MSSNLNYKQVVNSGARRTWDKETYEKKAQARRRQAQAADEGNKNNKSAAEAASVRNSTNSKNDKKEDEEVDKEEFQPAASGAAGPEGSKRAFLKARQSKVFDAIESKVGTSEMVSAEAAATTSTRNDGDDDDDGSNDKTSGVIKTGIGWHCKVCDCFLKDSHTYLDHINGRKHQRKLGFSMRVERSTKDQLMDRLKRLAQEKEKKKSLVVQDVGEADFDEMVKAKDEALKKQREERRRQRKERKKQAAEKPPEPENDNEEEEIETEGIDPAMAAMMGFSGFGGSGKNS